MILTAATLLSISGLSSATSMAWNKRDTTGSDISLYAYGGKTNGAPVFYDNGLAYIGYLPVSSSSTNISFTVASEANTTPWFVTANSTATSNVSVSADAALYIVPTSGAFEQAGFANSSIVPTGGETTGFSWFGTAVSFAGSESDFEMAFWAVETNTTGVWSLFWGKNNTQLDTSSSIVLKSTPPTST